MPPTSRQATHAGSWYTEKADELNQQLDRWLESVGAPTHSPARAIIAPHAGYRYSGSTAAFAYKQIDPERVSTIFILGPSHHVYLDGCALSPASIFKTPILDMKINRGIYDELHSTGLFEEMSLSTDEAEHSLEMHLPYIAKVMSRKTNGDFALVPVLVGAISTEKEAVFGKLFAKYLAREECCFVVSSDFCHWGSRFRYQPYDRNFHGEIFQSIQNLDHEAMKIIEEKSPVGFASYLEKTSNTICGRHPIGILLNSITTLQQNGLNFTCKFLKYAQSSKVTKKQDSSVSYASAAISVE